MPNKITRDLKEGIIDGAAKHGFNGKASGVSPRLSPDVRQEVPTRIHAIAGRLLPLSISANANSIAPLTVNIIGVEPGEYVEPDEPVVLAPAILIGSPPVPEPPVVIEHDAVAAVEEEPATVEFSKSNVRPLRPFRS